MIKLKIVQLLGGGTIEDLVEKGLRGVMEQGVLSGGSGKDCYYRHPENNNVRCVVGHMIPDNLFKSEFEGKPVTDIIARSKGVVLLERIQDCHDKSDEPMLMLGNIIDHEYIPKSIKAIATKLTNEYETNYKANYEDKS